MSIRLAICDDSEPFRQLLALTLSLEPDIEVVGEASDGAQGVELARACQPDVLLLDVAMPVMDGIEALPHVREAAPETIVIMLSGFASENVKRQAAGAGASTFLEKGSSLREIADAVRAASSRPATA